MLFLIIFHYNEIIIIYLIYSVTRKSLKTGHIDFPGRTNKPCNKRWWVQVRRRVMILFAMLANTRLLFYCAVLNIYNTATSSATQVNYNYSWRALLRLHLPRKRQECHRILWPPRWGRSVGLPARNDDTFFFSKLGTWTGG